MNRWLLNKNKFINLFVFVAFYWWLDDLLRRFQWIMLWFEGIVVLNYQQVHNQRNTFEKIRVFCVQWMNYFSLSIMRLDNKLFFKNFISYWVYSFSLDWQQKLNVIFLPTKSAYMTWARVLSRLKLMTVANWSAVCWGSEYRTSST